MADIIAKPVDLMVVGGDIILGPMSREALSYLMTVNIPVQFIQGNCEIAVLAQLAGRIPALPEQARDAVRWTAETLTIEHAQTIASWPKTFRIRIPELGDILFCHATPRNENEIFTRLTAESSLLPVFDGVHADLVVCGHTHMQFDRMVGGTRVVNAGSVGMPFGNTGANWLWLDSEVRLQHTTYDLLKAAEMLRAITYPNVDDFVEHHVLHSPTENEKLELFSRVEIGAKKSEKM